MFRPPAGPPRVVARQLEHVEDLDPFRLVAGLAAFRAERLHQRCIVPQGARDLTQAAGPLGEGQASPGRLGCPGTGKGGVESWVAVIRPANVLFEVDGVTEAVARESMRLAASKLPIKTRFISRHHLA